MSTSLSAAQKERLAKLEEWRKLKLKDGNGLNQKGDGGILNQTRRGLPTRSGPHPIPTISKVGAPILKEKQAIVKSKQKIVTSKQTSVTSKQKIQTIASTNSFQVGRDLKASKATNSANLALNHKSNSISKQEMVSDKISFKSEKISNVKKIVDLEKTREEKKCPKEDDLVPSESKENIVPSEKMEKLAPKEEMETIVKSIAVKIEQESPVKIDLVEQKEIIDFIKVKREHEVVNKQQDSKASPFLHPILTVHDALQAALVDQSLSRALFVALKTQNPVDKFEAPDGTLWSLTGEESSKYEFWSSWAKKEEKWMDLINAIDILNEGIDYIILQEVSTAWTVFADYTL